MDREYDNIAWFYNRYWGKEYPAAVIQVLERLLLPLIPKGASVLDLCCGTGHLTRMLADRKFLMCGIDLSPAMLVHARWNSPSSLFAAADARHFSFLCRFGAVISTFESINHILNSEDLCLVFSNVAATLEHGGSFLFDLLVEEAYRDEWAKSSAIVDDEAVCIIRGGYEPETSSCTFQSDAVPARWEEMAAYGRDCPRALAPP